MRRLRLAVLMVFVAVWGARAQLVRLDLPELVASADLIVAGKVHEVESRWTSDDRGTHIYSRITIGAWSVLKGRPTERIVVLEIPGGTVGDVTERVTHMPSFTHNEQVLLFLESQPMEIVGGHQGKWTMQGDSAVAKGIAVRTADLFRAIKTMVEDTTRRILLEELRSQQKGLQDRGEELNEAEGRATSFSNADVLVPVITSVAPEKASAGTGSEVRLTGTGFGATAGRILFYQDNEAPIGSWSDTFILCEVPSASSSGPVVVVVSSSQSPGYPFRVTFSYGECRWAGPVPVIVTYRLNENCPDVEDELAAVQAAATTWSNATTGFALKYGGHSSGTSASRNGGNEVLWGTLPSGILAQTTIWFIADHILECDMVFNTRYTWSTTTGAPAYDIESIALHEFGHFLVLDDLYGDIGDGEYDIAKVMYGYGRRGQTKRSLHPDDEAGVRWIYGGEPEREPVLALEPQERRVSSASGVTTFSVANTGGGTMEWTAEVTSGSSWLTITSGSSGTNDGIVEVCYSANSEVSSRTGTILVTAAGAVGSPAEAKVIQATGQVARMRPLCPQSVAGIVDTEFDIDVEVEDVEDLLGISFLLRFDPTLLVPASEVPLPFIGNDVLFVSHHDGDAGAVAIGMTRKADQGGVTGSGPIARLRFRVRRDIHEDREVSFTIDSVEAIDTGGAGLFLNCESGTTTLTGGLVVWPGDTDNDGIVNQADVLPLGLYWGTRGWQRLNPSTTWTPQMCRPWEPRGATYADATGDGVVDQADVLPIGLNWGATHTYGAKAVYAARPNPKGTGGRIRPLLEPCPHGIQVSLQVDGAKNLFGIAMELAFSPWLAEDSVFVEVGDFLHHNALCYHRVDRNTGRVALAVTRTRGNSGVSGSGVLANINVQATGRPCEIEEPIIRNIIAVDPQGKPLEVTSFQGPAKRETRSEGFCLRQNQPNPFNAQTEIHYDIATPTHVTLAILNALGQEVNRLVDEDKEAGSFITKWDGKDETGADVPSGTYLCLLRAQGVAMTRKIVLLR